VLVANMRNRHPAQLASAINSLQSLGPSRVLLGIGSGAAPGSRFAVEHEAIGTGLGTVAERRAMLRGSIEALRSMWAAPGGGVVPGSLDDPGNPDDLDHPDDLDDTRTALTGVVDGAACPPIVVGASAWPTIELALAVADGVNVRRTPQLGELLRRIDAVRHPSFEVSVLDAFDDVADDPARITELVALGVDRLVLGMSTPHDPSRLGRLEFS
jgi:alkanesulfonate monooxygenase SsuD/methylene tetrahydromethanopterin reductase-like flavin-dependent oxidoreductase (luciferase family)